MLSISGVPRAHQLEESTVKKTTYPPVWLLKHEAEKERSFLCYDTVKTWPKLRKHLKYLMNISFKFNLDTAYTSKDFR